MPRKQTKKIVCKIQKNLQFKLYHVENLKTRKANTVDPDDLAHYEPYHLDLQCLKIQLLLCLAL